MTDHVIHIAFADDHEIVRAGITEVISSSGKIVVSIQAANGKELLAKLQEADPLPDICLLDINMPVMNGYETQKELIRRYPQMSTLILTAHKSEQAVHTMLNYGVKGYLTKDCDAQEIVNAITSIYYEGVYYSKIANPSTFRAIRKREIKSPTFTDSEMDILRLLPTQLTYDEIARELRITSKSVEGHRENIFRKMKMNTRVAVVIGAIEMGLISPVAYNGRTPKP